MTGKTDIHTTTYSKILKDMYKYDLKPYPLIPNLRIKLTSVFTVYLLCIMASGCELGYYTHLAKGQLDMVSQRQPIQAVIIDQKTQPKLKQRLLLTQAVLQFAEHNLHLEVNGQYSHYLALDRPYALWSLSAAPRLSFQPHQWCYLLIGCANYRGYFDLDRAKNDEIELKNNGYETYIRGVSAYSTLGWFADPLLSSFTRYPNEDFIELIFHELAHAKMYIKNDTEFNESFATFIGQQGLKEFKRQKLLPESDEPGTSKKDFEAFKQLTLTYKDKLETVYKSTLDDAEKTKEKAKIMAQLNAEYQQQKMHWDRPTAYDEWIDTMNNASMLVFGDYENKVPFFRALFEKCKQDWICFYEASKTSASNL
jgi:predicted aminopeptidase